MTQEEQDELAQNARGMLLHPAVGADFNEVASIQSHLMRYATVDLGAPATEIRDRLLDLALVWPKN